MGNCLVIEAWRIMISSKCSNMTSRRMGRLWRRYEMFLNGLGMEEWWLTWPRGEWTFIVRWFIEGIFKEWLQTLRTLNILWYDNEKTITSERLEQHCLWDGCNQTNIQIVWVDSSLDHWLYMLCTVSSSIWLLHQFLVESSSPRVYKDKLHWNMIMTQQLRHKGGLRKNNTIIQNGRGCLIVEDGDKTERVMMLTKNTILLLIHHPARKRKYKNKMKTIHVIFEYA